VEALIERHSAAVQTLETLQEALKVIHDPHYKEVFKNLRDSVIQRFEYSIDTFCKFLRIYLQEKHNITIELVTPRATLRAAVDTNLLSEKEFNVLLECIADRNLTSHSYNEVLAQEMLERIPLYHTSMKQVITKLKL
jgi:nucleotidyltransferase substrate binding protein (TIGR01987 family)